MTRGSDLLYQSHLLPCFISHYYQLNLLPAHAQAPLQNSWGTHRWRKVILGNENWCVRESSTWSFYLSLNKFQPDISMRWPDADSRRHGVCRPQEIIVSHSSIYTTQPQYLHCYYSENINRARRKLITATIMPSYFCTTRCLFLTIPRYPTFTSA